MIRKWISPIKKRRFKQVSTFNVIRTTRTWNVLPKSIKFIFLNFYWCQAPTRQRIVFADTQLKIAQVVTVLLVEQCHNNTVIMTKQCCWTNNVVHILFQQCYSALMKQQWLFTVVGTRENNTDRTSLFAIVIIFCLMFESRCLFVGWLLMVAVTYLSRSI